MAAKSTAAKSTTPRAPAEERDEGARALPSGSSRRGHERGRMGPAQSDGVHQSSHPGCPPHAVHRPAQPQRTRDFGDQLRFADEWEAGRAGGLADAKTQSPRDKLDRSELVSSSASGADTASGSLLDYFGRAAQDGPSRVAAGEAEGSAAEAQGQQIGARRRGRSPKRTHDATPFQGVGLGQGARSHKVESDPRRSSGKPGEERHATRGGEEAGRAQECHAEATARERRVPEARWPGDRATGSDRRPPAPDHEREGAERGDAERRRGEQRKRKGVFPSLEKLSVKESLCLEGKRDYYPIEAVEPTDKQTILVFDCFAGIGGLS